MSTTSHAPGSIPGPHEGVCECRARLPVAHAEPPRPWHELSRGAEPYFPSIGRESSGLGDPRILLPRHAWVGTPGQLLSVHPFSAAAGCNCSGKGGAC